MSRDKLVPKGVEANWNAVVEEAETLAADYREEGWETLVIHPGDVTPLFGDPFGLDVLASRSEFEQTRAFADEHTFEKSHVYRKSSEDVVLLLLVFEADTEEPVVVLVPAYAAREDLERLFAPAREADEMHTHVRPLSDDERVTFSIDDPDLFFETD